MNKKFLYKISEKYASKWLVLFFDLCVVVFTFFLAYLIRYNFEIKFDVITFLTQIPFVVITAAISFLLVGSHKGVVRFTGIKDVINVLIGVNILATILLIEAFLTRNYFLIIEFNISGSIIYIHLLLNIFFLIFFKFLIKATFKEIVSEIKPIRNVLIYGAGTSGNIVYDAIINDVNRNIDVIGFIDDDERKIGKRINQINVFSFTGIDDSFLKKKNINQVIISFEKISPQKMLEISNYFLAKSIQVKIVPQYSKWIDGDLKLSQIKDINLEDLLGREPINIESPFLDEEYNNKIILITGAAGSIGSELVRKLTKFKYKKLILIDNAESPLYNLQQELIQNNTERVEAIIADVRNFCKMDKIFSELKPEIIFHAAAYKHVPLMENNPQEAVSVNIGGTINLADLALKYHINKFVLVSTDKAVNPTNVMGASKRIAELYINCIERKGVTKFIVTRFGNVLGSNGSVIPLFKKQIESGGPVTVTHKEICRYFMTIPEACSLVIEAASMGNGGEIFVFDMGKSVKIFDLAVNMISLSGFKFPEDINIKIIGLRPGEKIYEELLADGENTKPTYNDKIMIANTINIDRNMIEQKILDLSKSYNQYPNLEIVSKIKDIVSEYAPKNSKYEVLEN